MLDDPAVNCLKHRASIQYAPDRYLYQYSLLYVDHTKECAYRISHDMPHTNCFCECHKIRMAESKNLESKTF